jgi:hypothetical protein
MGEIPETVPEFTGLVQGQWQEQSRSVRLSDRFASGADALHQSRRVVQIAVLVSQHPQPLGGLKQFAGLQQKVRS